MRASNHLQILDFGKAMCDAHVQIITFGRKVEDIIWTRYRATKETIDRECIFLRCVFLASMLPHCGNPNCDNEVETAAAIELERHSTHTLRKVVANFPVCRNRQCQDYIVANHAKILNQYAVDIEHNLAHPLPEEKAAFQKDYDRKREQLKSELKQHFIIKQSAKQEEELRSRFVAEVEKKLEEKARKEKNKAKKEKKKRKQREQKQEIQKPFFEGVKAKRPKDYAPVIEPLAGYPYIKIPKTARARQLQRFFSNPSPKWRGRKVWENCVH